MQDVQKLMLYAADDSGSDMEELFEDLCDLQDTLIEESRGIEEVDPRINDPLPRIDRLYRTIDSFEDTEIRQLFRFESKDQLHRLVTGFQFPAEIRSGVGNKFSGEELHLAEFTDCVLSIHKEMLAGKQSLVWYSQLQLWVARYF
jgi:hypothetical protein